MTHWLCSLALALVWTLSAPAQESSDEPPVAGRPVGFSNIVGKYSIKVSAAPTEIQVEEAITMRVVITGAGPAKYEPNRKDLNLFFSLTWDQDFYVQELRDEHKVDRAAKTWLFVYRLKPKHARVEAIDDIKLIYYDPGAKRFVTKYADPPIKLTVKLKPDTSGEIELKDVSPVPESFYEHVEGKGVLVRLQRLHVASDWQLGTITAAPPLLCLAIVLAYWRFFPDEAKRLRRHRLGAAQRAMAHLKSDPASARDALRRYLEERFEFAVAEPTPTEVFAFLNRRGFALVRCKECQAIFQLCDTESYTIGSARDLASLAEAAARVIQSLEADPCARA